VYPGGPAERAGLRQNDLISHVDGQPVTNIDRLQLVVGLLPPSHRATVQYERFGGDSRSIEVELAKFPVLGRQVITNRPPAWRGIHVDYATVRTLQSELDAIDPEGCVLVREVDFESPAWRAGIREGMFISHVAGERVATPTQFREAVSRADGTIAVTLTEPVRRADGVADDSDEKLRIRQISPDP
jgi:serine protease Do